MDARYTEGIIFYIYVPPPENHVKTNKMKTKLFGMAMMAVMVLFGCKEQADPEPEVSMEEKDAPDYAAFDGRVAKIRSFYQAHGAEDLEAQGAMLSDTMQWSPPDYNGNQWLGKEELMAALKNYHDNFDNIRWNEGIVLRDSTVNGYWSGSVYPEEFANSSGDNVRVYGTWTATHTESGKEIGVKFFSLIGFNEDGLIISASDYFDVNGLAAQIAEE